MRQRESPRKARRLKMLAAIVPRLDGRASVFRLALKFISLQLRNDAKADGVERWALSVRFTQKAA
jgi:hypothetical protein